MQTPEDKLDALLTGVLDFPQDDIEKIVMFELITGDSFVVLLGGEIGVTTWVGEKYPEEDLYKKQA